jgi:hypothetical protein
MNQSPELLDLVRHGRFGSRRGGLTRALPTLAERLGGWGIETDHDRCVWRSERILGLSGLHASHDAARSAFTSSTVGDDQ